MEKRSLQGLLMLPQALEEQRADLQELGRLCGHHQQQALGVYVLRRGHLQPGTCPLLARVAQQTNAFRWLLNLVDRTGRRCGRFYSRKQIC